MKTKRRRKYKQKQSSRNILVWIVLIGVIFSFYLFANFSTIANFVNPKKIKFVGNMSLTPILSPTPTSIPTPTPVPLIGYCLNVPVLMYHHIQPNSEAENKGQKALSIDVDAFDRQMDYLVSSGYTTISAKQLADALINKTSLPQKSIVITIDDGYRDVYQYVYPILQKYRVVANLMIPSGLMGGTDYLSWGELQEMTRSGLVFVGNHTWSHYSITRGPLDKIKFEIATGKQQLQDYTGQNVETFTYPYGEFNDNAILVLKNEGFVAAFSEIPGFWQCDSFIMALHRTRIGNSHLSYYGL